MLRFLRSAMTSLTSAPRVPIPANGVDYRGKVVLAPMVRSGELPSRLVSLKYGADLVWGPETIDRALLGVTRRINPRNGTIEFARVPSYGGKGPDPNKPVRESIIYRIDPVREKGKLIFQIGSASPELAVQAAKVVAGDVSGIDLNSGCPKPFSTSGGMGAALLRTPDKLVSILEALVREVGTPYQIGISVKIRVLETPELTEALVSRLVKTGITGLTVHCRTTAMRPRHKAIRDQVKMIVSICHSAGVACLMNGDVSSRDHALALMEEYGVDGAMIATSAESNFSCFRSKADGGMVGWKKLVHDYLQACIESENRFGNTKYLMNMLVPGKGHPYDNVKQLKNYADYCRTLKFDDLLPGALAVDALYNLTEKSITKDVDATATATADADATPAAAPRSKAVQNAMENNESARAAGGATRPKAAPAAPSGGGPIRTNNIPAPAKTKPAEDVSMDTPAEAPAASEAPADIPADIPAPPEAGQKQELAA